MMMMMVSECSLSEDRLEQAGSALRERGLLGTPTWEFQDVLERRDVFPSFRNEPFFATLGRRDVFLRRSGTPGN